MEHVPSFSLSIVFPGCVDTWVRPALVYSLPFLCGTRSMSYHSISNHPLLTGICAVSRLSDYTQCRQE